MFTKAKGEFVQVLHNGSYYWVVVSNINCTGNEINYYHSVFHGKIKDQLKDQLKLKFGKYANSLKKNLV